jgi:hypothetical protein
VPVSGVGREDLLDPAVRTRMRIGVRRRSQSATDFPGPPRLIRRSVRQVRDGWLTIGAAPNWAFCASRAGGCWQAGLHHGSAIHGATVVVAVKLASDSGKARAGSPVSGSIKGLWPMRRARAARHGASAGGACMHARLRGLRLVGFRSAGASRRRPRGGRGLRRWRVPGWRVRAAGGGPGSGSGCGGRLSA